MDTPINIPSDLQAKVLREADACGMSVAEFVRISLEWAVARKPYEDPLFTDTTVYRDDGPTDLAVKHDDYLYGDVS